MLASGFYVLEKNHLQQGIITRPKKTMSVLGFFRTLRHGQSIPHELLVTGLDRMLYQIYRLCGEGTTGKQAVRQAVDVLSRLLYNPQSRQRLLVEAPVVILSMEYLEHGEHWQAGVRIRPKNEPLALFWLEQLFPRCEVTEISGESVCYCHF